jgi:adenylate kinase family enzyme
MKKQTLPKETVIQELEKMERKLEKGAGIAWINFPYSVSNLAVIQSSLKELGWCNNNFRISFDENDIFIEKDQFVEERRK